ncbi:hypothetical protein GUJ93_ZPchr0013g36597 [Zizania palustris]|uniref:Uncharacterized protein n=1 Tax=Zizania palustris TaxID=103762 RepID=A0A8J6C113_ZIZPA|nr:hypothetical protein GUJ93_ZPchr0013g36597 [Zizania palustris]
MVNPNWELRGCCDHDQVVFIAAIGVSTVVILALWRTFVLTPFKLITVFLHETSHALACKLTCGHVEGMQVHANEGGVTQTRGDIYWIILPAGYLGSSFWGMVFILASTNLLTTRIAAGCFILALIVVLFVAKNWFLRWLCIGFIIFIAVVWVIQEFTTFHILKYVILFIGVMNSLFSVYDIYDDLISRRVHSSDAEKFAEICPCPCNGAAWGVICSHNCSIIPTILFSGASSRLSFSVHLYTLDWLYCLEDFNLPCTILIREAIQGNKAGSAVFPICSGCWFQLVLIS